jgi:hypothetical protein
MWLACKQGVVNIFFKDGAQRSQRTASRGGRRKTIEEAGPGADVQGGTLVPIKGRCAPLRGETASRLNYSPGRPPASNHARHKPFRAAAAAAGGGDDDRPRARGRVSPSVVDATS